MSRSLLLPKFPPPTRLYLVKVCAPAFLFLMLTFASSQPAHAQYSSGWGVEQCDAQGNPTSLIIGTETGQATNTYPAAQAAVGAGCYPGVPDSTPLYDQFYDDTIGVDPPASSVSAENYYNTGYGNSGIYYAPDGSHSPINGSVTVHWDGQIPAYFKEVWQGSGSPTTKMPDHMDFLLSTEVYATANVDYGSSGLSSGLSATATASDGQFNETATASAGDVGASFGVNDVKGHHLVRASVDSGTGIAEVYLNGTTDWMASNKVPYMVPSSGGNAPPTFNGPTSAGAYSYVNLGIQQDSRDVMITSNLSTPDNPTYYTDPITYLKVANVRQPDGSMTDDILTPPLNAGGLGAPAGTPATYSGVISGQWGSNSTYKWNSTLNSPMAFSNQPISGTFNDNSLFGNNTQTIPNFAGTYYNPPASDGKSDIVTLTITDGVDGVVAANTYTVRFHRPYPINYHQDGPGVDIGGGVLKFSYKWDSSTGNLADLSNIVIGETITYDGNPGTYTAGYPGGYTPVSPPYSGTHDNPSEVASSTIATVGRWQDQHRPLGFSATMPQTEGTYTYTGTQTYWYYDKSDSVKKTLAGPYAIVRSVTGALYPPSGPNNIRWGYTIGKAGSYASLNLGDYGP